MSLNLHSLVSGAIGRVNRPLVVSIMVSVGDAAGPDGSRTPAYATPGSLTASVGAAFTASVPDPTNPTVVDVSAIAQGMLSPGDLLAASDGSNALPAGCTVVSQLSGATGGVGTYQINAGPPSGVLNPCAGVSASNVLWVTDVAAGVPQVGQTLSDAGALLAETMIVGLGTGSGGTGTYLLSQQQTVAPEAMGTALSLTAQVQPMTWRDVLQLQGLNLQGTRKKIYLRGAVDGIVRVALKGGDLVQLPDGSTWLVAQQLEAFNMTAGWTSAAITLQDGS